MKIVKYVIKSDGVPLLFNPRVVHSDAISNGVSAGFAIIDYDATEDRFIVKCYGGSESLKVYSRVGDCSIIQNYLNTLLCTLSFESIVAMQIF